MTMGSADSETLAWERARQAQRDLSGPAFIQPKGVG
jgi:hypothetical protein